MKGLLLDYLLLFELANRNGVVGVVYFSNLINGQYGF